jgi:hypothetical protein
MIRSGIDFLLTELHIFYRMCEKTPGPGVGGKKNMSFDLSRIGQLLQDAREEKNFTLSEVSDALFIRKRVVEAIEAGKWDSLPHEVYVKGYVTQYASFLGILDVIEPKLALTGKRVVSIERDTVAMSHRTMTTRWEPKRKVIGAVVVAIIAGGFFIFQNIQRPVYVAPDPSPQVETAYQTVATNTYEGPGDKVVFEPKKLMIACQQRTWVRIVIDGSEKKEFMMSPEEVVVLNGKEGFDLLIGNAGGVRIFYNGKDTGFSGEEGEVKRINIS